MLLPVRLLYIDDDEPLRTLAKEQLEDEGFRVDVADDGDTGLELLASTTYDVIVLDVRMPRLNGIETLKRLKAMNVRSRIIMLTAVDDITVAIEACKNGANDYLTKPFDIHSLISCIGKVTAR